MKFLATETGSRVSRLCSDRQQRRAHSQQTPIYQKIDWLLNLTTLNDAERGFLLQIKCRDLALILPDELRAIAAIWAIHDFSKGGSND